MNALNDPFGTVTWLLGDHLGSTSLSVSESGTTIAEAKYTPVSPKGMLREGKQRNLAGDLPTDYGYTGQREESALGLMYYVARWYDSGIGHFVQADTVVPGAGNPAAYNRYAYVMYNPLRYIDSDGHIPIMNFVDGEGVWTETEKAIVRERVWDVAQAIADALNPFIGMLYKMGDSAVQSLTAGEAFLAVFGGPVNFVRGGTVSGYAGQATGSSEVTMYTTKGKYNKEKKEYDPSYTYWGLIREDQQRVIVHELGHLFVNSYDFRQEIADEGLLRPWVDPNDLSKGWQYSNVAEGGIVTYYGYGGGKNIWQFGSVDLAYPSISRPKEEAADMFIGFVYGSFDTTDLGKSRMNFMQSQLINAYLGGY